MKVSKNKSATLRLIFGVFLLSLFPFGILFAADSYKSLTNKDTAKDDTKLIQETCAAAPNRESCTRSMISDINSGTTGREAAIKSFMDRGITREKAEEFVNDSIDGNKLYEINWQELIGLNKWVDGVGGFMLAIPFAVFSSLLYLIYIVIAFLVSVSGRLFDGIVQLTIGNFKFITDTINISASWEIIRNVINIFFIFILLYISISIILGSFGPKKKSTVASVVAAALLINFSLLFTKVMIDTGNLVAQALYERIGSLHFISETIMNGIRVPKLATFENITSLSNQAGLIITLVTQIILVSILFWAFLLAALLFIGRMLMLIMLMATSPIGFAGDFVPFLKGKAEEWRTNLFSQIAIAPVFFFFIIVVNEIMKATSKIAPLLKEAKSAAGVNTLSPIAPLLTYSLVIGMLIASIKVTKKLSGTIGEVMSKAASAIGGVAIGAATGGAALLATKTLGAGAAKFLASETGQKLKDSKGFGARMLVKGFDKTSKASFDVRNTSSFKTATGFIGDQTGLKVNYDRGLKIKKDGFAGAVERAAKADEDYTKLITKDIDLDITQEKIGAERKKMIDADIDDVAKRKKEKMDAIAAKKAERDALKNLNLIDRQKEEARIDRETAALQKEHDDIKNKVFDDETVRKTLVESIKKQRVDAQAEASGKSLYNLAVGGRRARAAAVRSVRKVGKAKSAADLAVEYAQKQAEENAAAGITPPGTPAAPAAPAPATPPPATPPTP